jgi:hypothetical protein
VIVGERVVTGKSGEVARSDGHDVILSWGSDALVLFVDLFDALRDPCDTDMIVFRT